MIELMQEHAVPATEPSDADLVRIILRSPGIETHAESELCRRLAPRIRLYGLRHLRQESAAADLTQNVLLLLIAALREGKLREPEKLASFVLGTCRMVVLDIRRGFARRERLLEQYGDALVPAARYPEPQPDLDRLRGCVQNLKERERSVIVMTYFQETEGEQVAQALGLSAANLRVIRHRAIERLRHCMGVAA